MPIKTSKLIFLQRELVIADENYQMTDKVVVYAHIAQTTKPQRYQRKQTENSRNKLPGKTYHWHQTGRLLL